MEFEIVGESVEEAAFEEQRTRQSGLAAMRFFRLQAGAVSRDREHRTEIGDPLPDGALSNGEAVPAGEGECHLVRALEPVVAVEGVENDRKRKRAVFLGRREDGAARLTAAERHSFVFVLAVTLLDEAGSVAVRTVRRFFRYRVGRIDSGEDVEHRTVKANNHAP